MCMVDSGIDMSHPDLSNLNLAEWSDFMEVARIRMTTTGMEL